MSCARPSSRTSAWFRHCASSARGWRDVRSSPSRSRVPPAADWLLPSKQRCIGSPRRRSAMSRATRAPPAPRSRSSAPSARSSAASATMDVASIQRQPLSPARGGASASPGSESASRASAEPSTSFPSRRVAPSSGFAFLSRCPMPTRILIADDHRMYREGLRALLIGDDLEVVAEASDGREAIRLATRHKPDIALVDISMSGLNGLDVTREVLCASPRSRVIVLTMHKDDAYVVDALRAGASGYVLKSQGFAELVQAIREVARGEVYVAKECWRPLVEACQSGGDQIHDPLSRREREAPQLIDEGKPT